ncbi:hypothetical protein ElyMa_002815900 [Elysia marginata]|uniref:Uncharacterized protein n=1 Tax=Elysia marginata TaxID=1093978 RepID=A0AAV4HRW0_9GAST|nr:hypothetical protein ElyMa_002815900 [Elysia marginata]
MTINIMMYLSLTCDKAVERSSPGCGAPLLTKARHRCLSFTMRTRPVGLNSGRFRPSFVSPLTESTSYFTTTTISITKTTNSSCAKRGKNIAEFTAKIK